MDDLKISNFKPHCLHLDAEVVFLATRKLTSMTGNKRMLSAFVNQMLEEFILEGEDRPETSIRQKARELADKVRHEKMSQRKLIIDTEAQKSERERQEAERQALIEKGIRDAVKSLGFRREWLKDGPHMNFSHHRAELEDAVSESCRLDLQWREIYPIVAAAVLEGEQV